MDKYYSRVSQFEDNLRDSYGKLSFMYTSLLSIDEDGLYIERKYADSILAVVKSAKEDLESAQEIFYSSNLPEDLEKEKKKEEDEL